MRWRRSTGPNPNQKEKERLRLTLFYHQERSKEYAVALAGCELRRPWWRRYVPKAEAVGAVYKHVPIDFSQNLLSTSALRSADDFLGVPPTAMR